MNKTKIFIIFTLIILSLSGHAQIEPAGSTTSTSPATDIRILEAIENVLVDIVERSKPAIVSVTVQVKEQRFEMREGTGFIFRKDGYILTNHHVAHSSQRIRIRLSDGRTLTAKLVGSDASTDIAVLKVNTREDLPTLAFADSDQVRVGQFAIAIGNPFQLEYTVTLGIVSGKGRSLLPDSTNLIRHQRFIQTDAWLNRGNSGGPLLNIYGQAIGMNSMIRRPDGTAAVDAVRAEAGFAIPSNQVKRISNQLITHGRVIRGWLGINMREVTPGIYVRQVESPSPAKRGGLQPADIIVEYNRQKVRETQQLKFLIADSLVGEKVEIIVLRGGRRKTLEITIGEMPLERMGVEVEPQSESWSTLGLDVRELGEHDFERYAYLNPDDEGVIVGNVKIDAPAPKAGIPRGALITAVNGRKVRTMLEFEAAFKAALKGAEITFEIKTAYSDAAESVTVKLEDGN